MADRPIMQVVRETIKTGDVDAFAAYISEDKSRLHVNTPFGSWLHIAASEGQLDIARFLIDCGLDVNLNGGVSGGNALRAAASAGHLDVLRYLQACGGHFDTLKPERNPLFGAIYNRHSDVVQHLLLAGIDATVRYSTEHMTDMDALAFAEERGETEIAELLRAHLRITT